MRYRFIGTEEDLSDNGFVLGRNTTYVTWWNYGKKIERDKNCFLKISKELTTKLIFVLEITKSGELMLMIDTSIREDKKCKVEQ